MTLMWVYDTTDTFPVHCHDHSPFCRKFSSNTFPVHCHDYLPARWHNEVHRMPASSGARFSMLSRLLSLSFNWYCMLSAVRKSRCVCVCVCVSVSFFTILPYMVSLPRPLALSVPTCSWRVMGGTHQVLHTHIHLVVPGVSYRNRRFIMGEGNWRIKSYLWRKDTNLSIYVLVAYHCCVLK